MVLISLAPNAALSSLAFASSVGLPVAFFLCQFGSSQMETDTCFSFIAIFRLEELPAKSARHQRTIPIGRVMRRKLPAFVHVILKIPLI
jgi:hypothetical protein